MSDTPTMYRATVPVLQRALRNLANVLEKGRAHAEARKIDPAVLLGCRLAPDMFALTRQVQIAADIAKAGAARLAGHEVPAFEDNETTFEELQARIGRTLELIAGIPAAAYDGAADREISIKIERTGMASAATTSIHRAARGARPECCAACRPAAVGEATCP